MIKTTFLLLPTLLLSMALTAEDKVEVYGEMKETKTKKEDGSEETLKKLLTVKGVDVQYAQCQKAFPSDLAKIPECIWSGSKATTPPINALADDIKKQVRVMYEQDNATAGRAPASDAKKSSNLTGKSKQLAEDYMSDPAVVELSKIMQGKLEEALLGDKAVQKDTKSVVVLDHAKFIELYRTELGKTIVNAFTSYCIESDLTMSEDLSVKTCPDKTNPTGACPLFVLDEDDDQAIKATIKKNIQSLKNAKLDSNTANATNGASITWSRCIASVSNVCYTLEKDFSGNPSVSSAQINRSKTRACTIMDYVKSARKNLIIADEQKTFYDTNNAQQISSLRVENARDVVITEKNSMDTVTTVTSKDIEKSYEAKNAALKKEIDKCINDKDQIIDPESCKKFISTDTDAKTKAMMEFGIRQFALEDKLDEKLKDKAEIAKYLKEEGYDKDKIAQMTGKDTDIDTIRNEIKARYAEERKAIIATMAEKIEAKTTKADGKIDATSGGADQKNLMKIRDEFVSRTDDLKQLVHFNNVVSSYLEIDQGNGKKSRNVASLFAEIKGQASSFRDIDKDQAKDLEKKASEAGLKQEKGEKPTQLSVDNLNSIFKYSTEK